MTLDEYLIERSPRQLSEATGISMASLSRIRHRKQKPSASSMELICLHTGGKVTPNDLLGIAC